MSSSWTNIRICKVHAKKAEMMKQHKEMTLSPHIIFLTFNGSSKHLRYYDCGKLTVFTKHSKINCMTNNWQNIRILCGRQKVSFWQQFVSKCWVEVKLNACCITACDKTSETPIEEFEIHGRSCNWPLSLIKRPITCSSIDWSFVSSSPSTPWSNNMSQNVDIGPQSWMQSVKWEMF